MRNAFIMSNHGDESELRRPHRHQLVDYKDLGGSSSESFLTALIVLRSEPMSISSILRRKDRTIPGEEELE